MVKRETKRKVRNIFTKIAFFFLAIFLILLLYFAGEKIYPFIVASSDDKIVRPVGSQTSISELKTKLSEKNIIVESIKEASGSGTYIAQLRNGVKVYFSQN